jgi:hypothetical protein
VVVIFTKFDARDDIAYGDLREEGISVQDARERAPARAVIDFEKMHLGGLYEKEYPPRVHIYLRGTMLLLSYVKATKLNLFRYEQA